RLIYQSPTGIWLENIAVRPCNKLLLTSIFTPTLYMLDAAATNSTLDEVYTIPNSTSLTGIAEYQPDVFAVVSSTVDTTTTHSVAGSTTIWGIDLTTRTPRVKKVAVLTNSTLINGLSSVPGHPDLVLAADSDLGGVYQIDMRTGTAPLVIQDSEMASALPPPAIGMNGLRVQGGALFFTNTQQQIFARVPISVQNGVVRRVGAVEVLGRTAGEESYDDFAMDRQGRAWLAAPPGEVQLIYPGRNGTFAQKSVAGDASGSSGVFKAPTSAAFGRGDRENERILYVTTEG
ncbi:hypothetical protein C8R43DRAFT_860323, partial [Mycena crocata]